MASCWWRLWWGKKPSKGVRAVEGRYVGAKDGRRGVEACHMAGVNNKADLFYMLAALAVGMRHSPLFNDQGGVWSVGAM